MTIVMADGQRFYSPDLSVAQFLELKKKQDHLSLENGQVAIFFSQVSWIANGHI